MTLLHAFRMIFRMAAVVALLGVSVAGPRFRPASAAGGNRPNNWTVLGSPALTQSAAPVSRVAAATATPRLQNLGRIPLSFEANQGQTDERVKFLSRGRGYTLFLAGNEAVLSMRRGSRQSKVESRTTVAPPFRAADQGSADLAFRSAAFPGMLRSPATLETNTRTADPKTGSALQELQELAPPGEARIPDRESRTPAVLRMKLVGANLNAPVAGVDELPGKSNYFIGNDPKKWRTNVQTYAKVKYAGVYPGVDLVYYGNQGQLEYDFVVAPGVDPNVITLDVGAVREPPRAHHDAPLQITGNGDLVAKLDGGEVHFHKPVVYQPSFDFRLQTPDKEFVEGRYVLRSNNEVSFEIGCTTRLVV